MELLKQIKQNSKAEYIANPFIHGNGERYLHLAAECALDLGGHIVADQNFGSPGSYREVFTILGEAGILAPELTQKMESFAGLRNVLAHDYLRIDHGMTYEVITKELRWIEEYLGAIEKFL